MKKVTLIIALCISIFAFSSPPEVPDQTIGIKIEFGKPKKNCQGFGICSLQIIFDFNSVVGNLFDSLDERTGYGYADVTETPGLILKLQKDLMTPLTKNSFFKDGKFIIEEDCPLLDEVIKVLNLKPGYTIKKGIYGYSENSKEFILTL